ncbi:ABC transporter ATP-binding protein [Aestuariicella hydrocarbonica]|uniref:ABC transporter ATP-binding protein n=1 Tax=Pseudomaricurvus hydrocarbonicus TaxID=1470433 RepID=A0A9E5MKT0_9GAMM|nr:ABC transporter ATP-binding protein [Aestuariicella hydrocarbonica]NHO65782.1 ABC transporter ATP-binding protein [Aestuariicella hydrocarbonica]
MSDVSGSSASPRPGSQHKSSQQKRAQPPETERLAIDWHLIRRFLKYLKPYRQQVLLGAAAVPLTILCSVAFPWLIMHIIDTQIVPGKISGLYWWSGLLLLVLIGNYLADALFNFFLQKSALYALRDMRADMFARVLAFPRRYFDKTPIGVTLTRLTSDLEAVNESFAQGLLSMVRDVLTTLALLIFLFVINWKLALMVLLMGPPTYFMTEMLRRRLRDAYASGRVVLSQGTGYLQECLNGIKTVQLYSAEEQVQNKYEDYTQGFFRAQSRSNFYDSALFAIIEGITTIAMALIIWFGARELLAATITYGVLIGFTQTLDRIFVPIRDFTSQVASIQRALAAFGHIEEIFEQPLQESEVDTSVRDGELTESSTVEDTFQSLVFDNVSFRYSDDGPQVLDGVSFQLLKGQKIALVGSTGSGKSTILRLLNRTYENYQGSILLNGRELREIPLGQISRLCSLMQQEVFLFNQSIAFNISLEREGISRSDVEAAARYVYADGFIERLPGQYEFQLQGNGSNLSAGQCQLVAFARAIASGSELVLLDEATASVDSVTEQLIQKAIDHVFMDKTVIAIAHRLSTIKHSDQILVLDKGRIIERGSHRELVQIQGFYANLLKELPGS